ncbi:MAG TPA: malate dehydrogenase [Caulobacteraceae bacterium]|jgi:malate dehydrogenase|nr:malate dehydrogenase [Caulobacteraceae bacterium]
MRIAVTGAAGQVGYALLYRLASGAVFGPDVPITLHLIELESAMPALEGVVMELEDCAFPTLQGVVATSDPNVGFDSVTWALLLAAVPRKQGQERGDLLAVNARIFKPIGQALNERAASDVRALVVGNPCNTNAYVAHRNAPEIPADRWFAMTALDHNRAKSALAAKAGVGVAEVQHMAIWGNHSPTMYPDYRHATIGGQAATEVIGDDAWFDRDFIPTVQNRGAAIIKARGQSSAASAANAVIDSVRALHAGTGDDWMSLGVVSRGDYDVPKGLVFSYPITSNGEAHHVVSGIEHGPEALAAIARTTDELAAERDGVKDLVP